MRIETIAKMPFVYKWVNDGTQEDSGVIWIKKKMVPLKLSPFYWIFRFLCYIKGWNVSNNLK